MSIPAVAYDHLSARFRVVDGDISVKISLDPIHIGGVSTQIHLICITFCGIKCINLFIF
jgi:hypothetical protein